MHVCVCVSLDINIGIFRVSTLHDYRPVPKREGVCPFYVARQRVRMWLDVKEEVRGRVPSQTCN